MAVDTPVLFAATLGSPRPAGRGGNAHTAEVEHARNL
jgi:hypothetical protein